MQSLHWILTTTLYVRSIIIITFYFIAEETEAKKANRSRSQSYYRCSCNLNSGSFPAEPIVVTAETLPFIALLRKLCEGGDHLSLEAVVPALNTVLGT